MAEIYLIRHGQASFGQANYDNLSELGKQQSFALGQFMATNNAELLANRQVKLVYGSLNRHRQTMDQWLAGSGLGFGSSSGSSSRVEAEPKASEDFSFIENAGFNEFDHENLLAVCMPEYADKQVLAEYLSTQKDAKKAFHTLYEQSIKRWISGQYDSEYNESFMDFKTRSVEAFQSLVTQSQSGERVFVFTSGGPIGMIVQWALNLSDVDTFKINGTLANASVTQFMTNSKGQCTLGYLNNYTHVQSHGLAVTYR